MTASLLRIVTIGPECTGKTVLARRLAQHLGVPCSEEYARAFVEAHPRPVVYDDVDAIGRGQRQVEDEAVAAARAGGAQAVVLDTDLVSTVVYSEHYYGDCPTWMRDAAAARVADLYLLHDIDVPWEADGFQRAEPERRTALFERFERTLRTMRASVVLVRGGWEERFQRAVAAVDALRLHAAGEVTRPHHPSSA